jgi:NADPH-dependent 7-cyano-7-deazaguanine reductase QueF
MKKRELKIVENTTDGTLLEKHILEIPVCCPVSKNPEKGILIIRYKPIGKSLEVASLYAYIHAYQKGLRDIENELLIRDMEGMIQNITVDCKKVLETDVIVFAKIHIYPHQYMRIIVR